MGCPLEEPSDTLVQPESAPPCRLAGLEEQKFGVPVRAGGKCETPERIETTSTIDGNVPRGLQGVPLSGEEETVQQVLRWPAQRHVLS